MKHLLLLVLITFALQGCYMAQKTRELGQGISNINHPAAVLIGGALYKTGKELEYDNQEIDTTEQTYQGEDLEVVFEEEKEEVK
ncbi:hypothetical protein ALC152_04970 [Arcobacter sp. 15-2]|uniref:hypothetical protein n=1 Tax=Arcobacter sp. 15-2 TaxID=3374109 RepID=UPI00399C85D9